jgi:hypothetical protein
MCIASVARAQEARLDRTVLPIAEPTYPPTEIDVRKATPPPRFEVKAPAQARKGRAFAMIQGLLNFSSRILWDDPSARLTAKGSTDLRGDPPEDCSRTHALLQVHLSLIAVAPKGDRLEK